MGKRRLNVVFEEGWAIAQSNGHDEPLVLPIVGAENCEVLITRSNTQLVEVRHNVKFGVELGLGKTVQGFLNQGD
jgi:hypothetical protein